MNEKISELRAAGEAAIAEAPGTAELEDVRVRFLGRKAELPNLLRGALAFGAASVALGPGTADPYGPKAVRASMGALFDVPVARVRTVEELPGRRIALVAHGGDLLAPDGDTTLVVGAEREGLPDDVVAACDATATIPVRAESLNAAMAATIALYECNRRMAAP